MSCCTSLDAQVMCKSKIDPNFCSDIREGFSLQVFFSTATMLCATQCICMYVYVPVCVESLHLHWRCSRSVVTKDALFCLFFFFLLISLSGQNLRSILTGYKHSNIETLHSVQNGSLTDFTVGFTSSSISRNGCQYTIAPSACCYHNYS